MIGENTNLEAARAELERDRAALEAREVEIETETIRRLETAHDELVIECRAAQDQLAATSEQCEAAQEAWRDAEIAGRQAESAITQHHGAKPRTFPTPKEIAKWEKTATDLILKCETAASATATAWTQVDHLQNERRKQNAAFEDLKAREHSQRLEINFRRAELAKRKPKPIGQVEVVDGGRLVASH